MNNKIFIYLFTMKIKYIVINTLFLGLFIQLINLLEISKIIEEENSGIYSILFLSILKLPTLIIEIMPFVIVISTSFVYRNLITNNELISMRNIGYSILDIFKPISLAIFLVGIFIIIFINPLSSKSEKMFDSKTAKDFSDLYSINIKDNEIWIKNIQNKYEKYFINISNMDLEIMSAKDIKIIYISNNRSKFYLAKEGKIDGKKFKLKDVVIYDIDRDVYENQNNVEIIFNFNDKNLINSISNYKYVPYYNYIDHIKSLKKFNLFSSEISLYYLSEILKPFFLVIIAFTVMGFAGKFKRNEGFFKVLFISMLIGFLFFLMKEVLTALTISYSLSFWLSYFIIFSIPTIIGLYQILNIEFK